MSQTLITSRDPKGLHIIGLFEVVFNKLGLDESRAQRVIENGGEFQVGLRKLIKEHAVSDRYADEEVSSNYGYPTGYAMKPLSEQVGILVTHFGIDGCGVRTDWSTDLPNGAEGLFAIPRWQAVAQSYGEAVEKVFTELESTRKFTNCRKGNLGPQYLRQHARTAQMMQKLTDQQNDHDILVVPAQLGLRHCGGRSVRRAREVFEAPEFGLGVFALGCMLLTHPERLVSCDDLWIDCAGDQCTSDADFFSLAPWFSFRDGGVEFNAHWYGPTCDVYGSASGFLPSA